MKKQIQILIAAASLVGLFATQASFAAGNIAAGAEKSKACEACHGAGGNAPTTPDFPRLAGQHADYLFKALRDYKSGARKNAIMASQVEKLSRQDLQDLAAYFASQSGSLTTKR